MTKTQGSEHLDHDMLDEDLEQLIPSQRRIEELAEYFDRTDTGDADGWEEATEVVIVRPELDQISIRLPREDIAELKRRAHKAGIGYTTLLRMILRDYLRRPAGAP